ncbi:XAC2610-related protein [Emticicia fontis]
MYLPRLTLLLPILYCCISGCSHETKQTGKIDSTKVSIQPEAITQECSYTNLSKEFDIKVFLKRFKVEDSPFDSCIVDLTLFDKQNHQKIDILEFTSSYFWPDFFQNCNKGVYYSTNVDIENGKSDENYPGDIIIADLNFDGKEDIAVIQSFGATTGGYYIFYLQKFKKFVLDEYLTYTVGHFPTKTNKYKRTLTTYQHANARYLGEQIYFLDKKTNKWRQKSHKFVPYIE